MNDRSLFTLATASRLLAGTVIAAAVAIVVVTAVVAPWPTVARTPVQVTATPAPADTVIACGGPLLVQGRDASQAVQLMVAAAPRVTSGVPSGATLPVESSLVAASAPGSAGPTVLTAAPAGREVSDVAAAASAAATSEDLAGFAASACRPPLMESWLVGGATTTGASDLVVLANPGSVAATVQLTVYGASGPQVPPGGTDLVIPPATERVVPLAGLILGEESPVVRVTATGAPVTASLQASITRTLATGGVDQIGATASAETTVVVPGVIVTQPPGPVGGSETTTALRLLAPTSATTATVTVTGTRGSVAVSREIPLTAGLPADVDLSGLAVGGYTVRVDAQTPVVAAVWQTTGVTAGSDFAWYAAAPEVAVPSLLAVPLGPNPVLWIANPATTDAAASVAAVSGDDALAAAVSVTVAAGAAVAVPLRPGAVYRLTPTGGAGVRAMVSFSGEGALAGFPVWPAAAAASTVRVYP